MVVFAFIQDKEVDGESTCNCNNNIKQISSSENHSEFAKVI
jgi:hypothetical protein